MATAHHLACVTFNAMRGGVPLRGGVVHREHVQRFLAVRSTATARRAAGWVEALPERLSVAELVDAGRASGDPDLIRLTLELLPLGFSRRHGDPSRPWNRFEITATDHDGQPGLGYQGNWRDVFQNWEALAWSYPALVEGMVATFLNATTLDGYNPYRISDAGLDWEVPEPDNPWSNIGYWSDHQIVYLSRLLDLSVRFHPGRLREYLNQPVCTAADVPYRIVPYPQIVADPVNTIRFDAARDLAARARVALEGADGLLCRTTPQPGGDAALYRTTMADKLLLLLATKLVNLVPDGGIWMTTQRPEWNDANNALVGSGVSVVTAAQLFGYVEQLAELLRDVDVKVSRPLADLIDEIRRALDAVDPVDPLDDRSRRGLMDRLGQAGSAYREQVYAAAPVDTRRLPAAQVARFLRLARSWLAVSLARNRREDGLFHSYNTLALGRDSARLDRLSLMLEGQVAVLSSGLLTGAQALVLVRALRRSALYRPDQHSYLLYPDRDLPDFLEHNLLAAELVDRWASRDALLADPERPVLVADAAGGLALRCGSAQRQGAPLDARASQRHDALPGRPAR